MSKVFPSISIYFVLMRVCDANSNVPVVCIGKLHELTSPRSSTSLPSHLHLYRGNKQQYYQNRTQHPSIPSHPIPSSTSPTMPSSMNITPTPTPMPENDSDSDSRFEKQKRHQQRDNPTRSPNFYPCVYLRFYSSPANVYTGRKRLREISHSSI